MTDEVQLKSTRFDTAIEEWKDMPEFVQDSEKPYKLINVRFRNEEDYKAFAKLIGQELSDKTKAIWYPKRIHGADSNLRWVDEDEVSDIHTDKG